MKTFLALKQIKAMAMPVSDPSYKIGVLTIVTAFGVQVNWDGEGDSGAGYICIDQYVPSVGDRVVGRRTGKTWLIEGSINGGSAAGDGRLVGEIIAYAGSASP